MNQYDIIETNFEDIYPSEVYQSKTFVFGDDKVFYLDPVGKRWCFPTETIPKGDIENMKKYNAGESSCPACKHLPTRGFKNKKEWCEFTRLLAMLQESSSEFLVTPKCFINSE